MRICRLVWSFPRAEKISYGLGPNFYYISKEQVKQGYEVDVIAGKKGNEPNYEEIEGIRVHRVTAPNNINSMKKLSQLNDVKAFDIIHAHGTCGILYPFLRNRIQKPLVVQSHGSVLGMMQQRFSPPSFTQFMKSRIRESISILREKYYWQRADKLIVVSFFLKEEIEKLYKISGSRIEVAYNGVDISVFKRVEDPQRFKDKLGLGDKRIILYVGHFGLRKGITYLLEAMSGIIKEDPRAFLLCVGGTPEWLGTDIYWSVLERKLRQEDLQDHVKLIGQIPHLQLPYYYSVADVFAFPSLYEAMGKVIIEAMACETPVVASRVGGIKEVIDDGVNGLLMQPKSIESIQKSILTVLQDRQLARRLTLRGRETVESRFTWKHSVMQMTEAYKKL